MNHELRPHQMGIYRILNCMNGKNYVGSAVSIKGRFAVHICELRSGKHHSIKLQRSWNKHGEDAFKFEVLEFCEKKELLIEREQFWIDDLNSFVGGYNANPRAGSALGRKQSVETKAKLSEIVRKQFSDPRSREEMSARSRAYFSIPENRKKLGEAIKAAHAAKSPEEKEKLRQMRAALMTSEMREKIRAGKLGKKPSEEARRNLSLGRIGIIQSEATKAKRRATLMGHCVSNETRKKIRQENLGWQPTEQQRLKHLIAVRKNHRRGFTHSPETRARISAARIGKQKGVPKSSETRERMRIAALRRYRGENYNEVVL